MRWPWFSFYQRRGGNRLCWLLLLINTFNGWVFFGSRILDSCGRRTSSFFIVWQTFTGMLTLLASFALMVFLWCGKRIFGIALWSSFSLFFGRQITPFFLLMGSDLMSFLRKMPCGLSIHLRRWSLWFGVVKGIRPLVRMGFPLHSFNIVGLLCGMTSWACVWSSRNIVGLKGVITLLLWSSSPRS